MKAFFAVLSVLACALGGVRGAIPSQYVMFSSFGPANSYSTATVWAVSGASTTGGYRGQAEFFDAAVSGSLSSVDLAMFHVSGSRLCNLFLAEDNGAGAPGTVLESFNNVSVAGGLMTLSSVVKPLLQAGTRYWLCDEPAAANSLNGWYYNNQGQANGFAYERAEWSWSPIGPPAPNSGVFRVTVALVPEPSLWGLGLAAVLGGGLVRGRRKA